jgi:hypothetical protein
MCSQLSISPRCISFLLRTIALCVCARAGVLMVYVFVCVVSSNSHCNAEHLLTPAEKNLTPARLPRRCYAHVWSYTNLTTQVWGCAPLSPKPTWAICRGNLVSHVPSNGTCVRAGGSQVAPARRCMYVLQNEELRWGFGREVITFDLMSFNDS